MKKLITAISTLGMPLTAFAHAGGHSEVAINHISTSMFHALPVLGLIAIISYQLAKKYYSNDK